MRARAGSCRQPKVAVSYYREMLRRGIQPDAQTHNSLINAFVKAGENEKALQVAESMRQRGVVPTLVTYNTLLDGAARHGKFLEHIAGLTETLQSAKAVRDAAYQKSHAARNAATLALHCRHIGDEAGANVALKDALTAIAEVIPHRSPGNDGTAAFRLQHST